MSHKPLLCLSALCSIFLLFPFSSSYAQAKRADSHANKNCGCQVFIENVGPQTSGFLEVVACGSITSDVQCFPGSYKESIPFLPWIFGEQAGFFHVSDPEGSVSFRLEGVQAKNVRAKVRLLCDNGTSRAFFLSEDAPYGVNFQGCQPQIPCPTVNLSIFPNFRARTLNAVIAGGFGDFQVDWGLRNTADPTEFLFYSGTSIPMPCGTWDISYRVRDLCSSCEYEYVDYGAGYLLCDPDNDLGDGERLAGQEVKISLYPNPASKYVLVQDEHASQGVISLNIYDLKGSKYEVKDMSTSKHLRKIDISHYPEGTYFIQLLREGTLLETKKLIIRR